MDENTASSTNTHQNVTFMDENIGTQLVYNPILDSSVYEDMQPDTDLKDFLSRPVLLNTYSWDDADIPGTLFSMDPWYEYFNSTPIKKKLDNYAFISCNLKLKFVINASPFYYGSVLISYHPLLGSTLQSTPIDAGYGQFIQYSQKPHVYLFPQTNQGGEMTLPFFYHKNWLNAGSATDLQNMGTLRGDIMQILRSANGVTGASVAVQVYGWAEDVRLMGPTIQLAVQSKDEYGDGPISKPASAIASALGRLGNIPVIGPYMTATSMAATAVGKIAHLFGYTNVPNINNVEPMKPMPFGHFASPEISTPVEKLTLDPKNELCIDPRTVGINPSDELAISNIISRESYFTAFTIDTTDTVDTLLFSTLVTPVIFNRYDPANGTIPYVRDTPMSYISRMFVHWRGDVIFRFRFICTQYHKGRVRISYDPSGNITTSSPDYSTIFNEVIDIGAENDIEVVVPYMQATPWLDCSADNVTLPFAVGSGALTRAVTSDNGLLTVRIVTPLTAPVETSEIAVQVFARAADNMEFAYPRDLPLVTVLALQSRDEISYAKPIVMIAGNAAGKMPKDRYLTNMGENCVSLRQLLRRTNYVNTSLMPATTTPKYAVWTSQQNKYPPYYGYQATTGINTAVGTYVPGVNYGFNYTSVNPYTWIAPMFVAQRGSMIWHYNVDTTGFDSPISSIAVSKYHGTLTYPSYYNVFETSTASPSSSLLARFAQAANTAGSMGMSLTNQITESGMSVSMPNYNKYRFHFTSPQTNLIGREGDGSRRDNVHVRVVLKPSAATKAINGITVDRYCSIGTDFTFFFFLCTPAYQALPLPTAV